MNGNLIAVSIVFSVLIILFILFLLRKGKVSIKYSIVWVILFSILIISIIVPELMDNLTKLLGFQAPSNMVISLILALLVIISISLTVIVSAQDKKIRILIQEVSMLKKDK